MAVTSFNEQDSVPFPAPLQSYLIRCWARMSLCIGLFFALLGALAWGEKHNLTLATLLAFAYSTGYALFLRWAGKSTPRWYYTIKHEFYNLKHEMVAVEWSWHGLWGSQRTLNLPPDNILDLVPGHWRDLPALRIDYRSGGWSPKRRTAWIIFEEADRAIVDTQIVPFLKQFRMAD